MQFEPRFEWEMGSRALAARRNLTIIAGTFIILYITGQHEAFRATINLGIVKFTLVEYSAAFSAIAAYNALTFHLATSKVREQYAIWRGHWKRNNYKYSRDEATRRTKKICGQGYTFADREFQRYYYIEQEDVAREIRSEKWRARREFLWWEIYLPQLCLTLVIILGSLVSGNAVIRDLEKLQTDHNSEVSASAPETGENTSPPKRK